MQQIKPIKALFLGIIIHAILLWAALVLGYNSYKELMREIEPLTRATRDYIKATFPWAILTFSGLYLIFSIKKKTDKTFLAIWQYASIISICAVLLNLFFFSKGRDILIPLNLSIFYFLVLLTIWWGLNRMVIIDVKNLMNLQDWFPPIVYRLLMHNLPKVQASIKEKPSAPFIIGFMLSLIICAFLLIFKVENASEEVANVAYFLLVIGVGIEVYQMIRYGEKE